MHHPVVCFVIVFEKSVHERKHSLLPPAWKGSKCVAPSFFSWERIFVSFCFVLFSCTGVQTKAKLMSLAHGQSGVQGQGCPPWMLDIDTEQQCSARGCDLWAGLVKVPVMTSPAHCLHVCPMEQLCGALFQNILWILGSNHLPFCQIEQGWCIRKVRKNGAHPLLITML